jgi:septum formation protein
MDQELIVLASDSPRRRQLLSQISVEHRVHPVNVDEGRLGAEPPLDYVQRVALAKATAAWTQLGGAGGKLVLGADTAVCVDDAIFGKPRDGDDAAGMLARLSGTTHRVITAVAAIKEGNRMSMASITEVTFRSLSPSEIDAYVGSGEPMGKAGAYAVQGLAAIFVERLEGSFSGVMGLPLFETAALLREFGVDVLAGDLARATA